MCANIVKCFLFNLAKFTATRQNIKSESLTAEEPQKYAITDGLEVPSPEEQGALNTLLIVARNVHPDWAQLLLLHAKDPSTLPHRHIHDDGSKKKSHNN